MKLLFYFICFFFITGVSAQNKIDSFRMLSDVKITIDAPTPLKNKRTIVILFALPNGNTTEQTMGKKLKQGDDWHFDIQHIRAQTTFLREKLPGENIVVAYLENNYKSWPLWKQKNSDCRVLIPHIVDTILQLIPGKKKTLYLNGHSGGGSFIFGYLDAASSIPKIVKRISFLDSDYGYDSSYYQKVKEWLQSGKENTLTVFAYNDSVALYNGKPFVSATGGAWYRSYLMLRQLQNDFPIRRTRNDSLIFFESNNKKIGFFFKTNPDRKIFHTQQVELNGFIHSILFGTKKEDEGYKYFEMRAYGNFIID